MEGVITITGARQHNLKNISLTIPKNKLIVFTGVSGSGKSSLAFDTIYAEGQRRYVESLSSYARQFLGIMNKPDVDNIIGLSPAISIDQKSTSHNPRSTVGTVTEIYDYLRLLYARIGHPHCPTCGREISKLSAAQIVTMIIKQAENALEKQGKKLFFGAILAPVIRERKGEFTGLFENIRSKGYTRIRIDGTFYDIDEDITLIKTNKHTIDVVVDRISLDKKTLRSESLRKNITSRLTEAVEQCLKLSGGYITVGDVKDSSFSFPDKPKNVENTMYSEHFSCPVCSISLPELEPRLFSFNSPQGACITCSGIGTVLTVDPVLVLSTELSISEGGILPFAKMFFHDTWFSRIITTVAKSIGIDERKPLKFVSDAQKEALLYGTGDVSYEVEGTNRFSEITSIHETFSGIIPELRRRHIETQSDFVREEIEKYMRKETCNTCNGTRLKKESLTVTIDGFTIADITNYSIFEAIQWFKQIDNEKSTTLSLREKTIARPILKEIITRLQFLHDVGLTYLTLHRSAMSLSGGEAQRIRLASQIGSGLSGVLYVLDEPSIGLHQRDNKKLIDTLQHLRDLGNTVIVVEHDRDMMESADVLVDFGPGAGERGGSIIAQGSYTEILKKKTLTASYLSGKKIITRPSSISFYNNVQKTDRSFIRLIGASHNNLKNVTLELPLGKLICITGVSGSGKSSLIVDTLYPILQQHFFSGYKEKPGVYERVEGLEAIDKTVLIDQSPIGRTPRSNPATYTGLFTYIRELFAMMPEAKARGYSSGRFSFNVKGGRCEACEGEGQKRIEMQFLSDVFVTCEVCHGTRYNAETLEVTYHEKTIADVLAMSVDEAVLFFQNHSGIVEKLKTIQDVGLGYIKLGQPATMLSGGEAQRVKLATELSRRATGKTVYILDEPTTGLHFADLEKLLHVLDRLVSYGNTVIVIEHNLDIIKNADWIIDMGPEGGDDGGSIIATGKPSDIKNNPISYTGKFLE